MEPLAASAGITPLLRPVGSVSSDPQSFLKEGRLMQGEVMQRLGGDSVLIQIGDQKVTAQTQVELQPGNRFLFQVEQQGGELVLRMLEDSLARAKLDAALVDTLRTLIGSSRPIGEVHGQVLGDLDALGQGEGLELERLQKLASVIGARAFAPGLSGEEFEKLLSHSSLAYESVLMASLVQVGADDLESALKRLASAIRTRLLFLIPGTGSLNLQQVEAFVANLPSVLRQVLDKLAKQGRARQAESSPASLAALASDFESELESWLEKQPPGEVRDTALENLRSLRGALLKGREAALLRALSSLGGRHPMSGEEGRARLAQLAADPKGQLLAGMLESEDPRVHELLGRTLAAFDLEQLVGSLRREFGEGEHLSLPVPDAPGFATAHLFIQADEGVEADGPGGSESPESSLRLIFGVEFSQLGPLRADLLWHGGRLSARIGVAQPAVADRLRRAAAQIEEGMAQGGAAVKIIISDATRSETDVEVLARDIRFLRDHHLMDVRG